MTKWFHTFCWRYIKHWANKTKATEKNIKEWHWEKCLEKTPEKHKTSSFWLHMDFNQLTNKSSWMKVIQGRYILLLNLKSKTYIYFSPSLLCCKVYLKVNVKTTMQYYDNLASCSENKLNFVNWKSNYLKMFDQKLSLLRCEIYHSPFFI